MVFPGLSPGARSPINRGKPQSPRGVDTVDSALYTNTNTQMKIHKYKYTSTITKLQKCKYKYANTQNHGMLTHLTAHFCGRKYLPYFFISELRWIQRQYLHVGKAD